MKQETTVYNMTDKYISFRHGEIDFLVPPKRGICSESYQIAADKLKLIIDFMARGQTSFPDYWRVKFWN